VGLWIIQGGGRRKVSFPYLREKLTRNVFLKGGLRDGEGNSGLVKPLAKLGGTAR